jgi:hypothetical protein
MWLGEHPYCLKNTQVNEYKNYKLLKNTLPFDIPIAVAMIDNKEKQLKQGGVARGRPTVRCGDRKLFDR